jgi:hypothetical protein
MSALVRYSGPASHVASGPLRAQQQKSVVLFDYFIGAGEQRLRDILTERLGRL